MSEGNCYGGVPVLSGTELDVALADLTGWDYAADAKLIHKRFEFKGFYKTMAFVNAVAWIANEKGHHPDMQIGYNYAQINWQTHAVGGVTETDIVCAKLVEQLLG